MADISSVRYEQIKDIWESLDGLSCKLTTCAPRQISVVGSCYFTDGDVSSSDHDSSSVLDGG